MIMRKLGNGRDVSQIPRSIGHIAEQDQGSA